MHVIKLLGGKITLAIPQMFLSAYVGSHSCLSHPLLFYHLSVFLFLINSVSYALCVLMCLNQFAHFLAIINTSLDVENLVLFPSLYISLLFSMPSGHRLSLRAALLLMV